MNLWLKLAGALLIVAVVITVVSPDLEPLPTVALISRATQKPHVLASAAITIATNKLWVQHSTRSPLAFLFRGSGNHATDLIDFNCTRLC